MDADFRSISARGRVKIRKSVLKQDLRDMPIDHGDMFLMSQVDDLIEVSEVVDIAPWEANETERRLNCLVELGLLEWVNEFGQSIERERRDTQPDFYVAVTLRPKAPVPIAELFRKTESSVVALRTQEGLLLLDQAVIHNDRSVFSRATVVDEDADARSAFSRITMGDEMPPAVRASMSRANVPDEKSAAQAFPRASHVQEKASPGEAHSRATVPDNDLHMPPMTPRDDALTNRPPPPARKAKSR